MPSSSTRPPLTRRRHLLMFASLASLAALGCGAGTEFAAAVNSAENVSVFEGLPHQRFEEELYRQERAKPVKELLGYPFYEGPVELEAGDLATLRAVLGDGSNYQPFGGEKKCGGFHPDWAVEWARGADRFAVLVCFGCDEVKVLGPGGESRHDVVRAAIDALQKLLGRYRKNRPTPTAAKE